MTDLRRAVETEYAFKPAKISALNRFLLKGGQGEMVDSVRVTPRGFEHDREFMAVVETGMMLTQRKDPKLALIATHFVDVGNIVSMSVNGGSEVVFDVLHQGKTLQTTVHSSTGLRSVDQGDLAAEFASEVLGKKTRIVRLANDYQRIIKPEYASAIPLGVSNQVGFADGAAISIASEASLAQLNLWVQEDTPGYPPISFRNFRTNIEVDSFGGPFYEDQILVAQIGDSLRLHLPWLNARCVVTTRQKDGSNNPKISEFIETKQKNAMQPLFSLHNHRDMEYWPGKTGDLFGVNAQPAFLIDNPIISIGDKVNVIQVR